MLLCKRKAWKKYKTSRNKNDLALFKKYQLEYKNAVVEKFVSEERKLLDSSNLKTFFQFVNKRLSNKTTATFLIDTESLEKVFDDVKKADLLNKYFASVFTVDNKILPEFEARRAGNLNDVQFSER